MPLETTNILFFQVLQSSPKEHENYSDQPYILLSTYLLQWSSQMKI